MIRTHSLTIGLGLLDSSVKVFVYFLHERLWLSIPFGRIRHPLEHIEIRQPLTEKDKQVIQSKLTELGYLAENI